VQKSFRFSGGQSQDTAEYPFGGLWSNEYLNEKPQSLTVEGYLRGPAYITQRNKLIEALRIPTDDDNPGYIDLPFWGRFPVVVDDNYEVSEHADEQGQCAVSISFTRAGVSITERLDSLPSPEVQLENAAATLEAAAINDFETKTTGNNLDKVTFAAVFGRIKNVLLGIIGRIQGAQTFLNAMTNEVLGITNLINRGVRLPYDLGKALFNAGFAIAGGIHEIKNSIAMYGRAFNRTSNSGPSSSGGSSGSGGGSGADGGGSNGSSGSGVSRASGSTANKPSLPLPDNEKNALVQFLSASTYTIALGGNSSDSGGNGDNGSPGSGEGDSGGDGSDSGGSGSSEAAAVSQEATKKAVENLYRVMAFLASSQIIANMDSLTYQKAQGYWRLIKKLAESIDQENPVMYAAIQDMRGALARKLSRLELSGEMSRNIAVPVPLLYLAYYLGCDEDKIRELNSIADSFVIEGDVIYV
jgi:hypothetical protein